MDDVTYRSWMNSHILSGGTRAVVRRVWVDIQRMDDEAAGETTVEAVIILRCCNGDTLRRTEYW